MIFSLITMMAVAIVSVFFALENTETVRVYFFGYPVDSPVGVFLLIAVSVGVLIGVFLMLPAMLGRSIEISRHKRRIEELEQIPPEKFEQYE